MLYPILLQRSGFQVLSTDSVLTVVIVIDGLIQSLSKEASQVKAKFICNAFVYTVIPKCLTEGINAYSNTSDFVSVYRLPHPPPL